MLKRFLAVTTIIVLIIACGIISPWRYIDIGVLDILGVEERTELATLQVTSLGGEIEIMIDGESRGVVGPEGSPFLIEDVLPGQRLITISRHSADETGSNSSEKYVELERMLNFTEDSDTVIAYELGPTDEFSKGQILTAFKSYANPNSTTMSINTVPEATRVYLDGILIGETPINSYQLSTNQIHSVKLERTGYEDMEFKLLPEEQADRDKLVGYDILVEANLFLIPIEVDITSDV